MMLLFANASYFSLDVKSSLEVNEVAKFVRNKGVSTLSTIDFTTIFNKIEIPKNRIEKLMIKEMQWPVQGELIYVCVFYEKNRINYLFVRNLRKSKLKYSRNNGEDCGCNDIDKVVDGVNRIDLYILPFSEGKFLVDSAKHEVCQSMW